MLMETSLPQGGASANPNGEAPEDCLDALLGPVGGASDTRSPARAAPEDVLAGLVEQAPDTAPMETSVPEGGVSANAHGEVPAPEDGLAKSVEQAPGTAVAPMETSGREGGLSADASGEAQVKAALAELVQRAPDIVALMRRHAGQETWKAFLRGPLEVAALTGDADLTRVLARVGADAAARCRVLVAAGGGGGGSGGQGGGGGGGSGDGPRYNPGGTLLHLAAAKGHAAVVQQLVLAGASVDSPGDPGTGRLTPLHSAAAGGQAAAVRELLRLGAYPDARETRLGMTPLMLAANAGHVEAVNALLAAGADRDAADHERDTALHHALLCHGGAWTPRMAATVLALLEAGANPSPENDHYLTPLHVACAFVMEECAALLLRFGASEAARGAMYMETPEDVLGRRRGEEDADPEAVERVRRLLLAAPADRAWHRRGWLVLLRARRLQAAAAGVAPTAGGVAAGPRPQVDSGLPAEAVAAAGTGASGWPEAAAAAANTGLAWNEQPAGRDAKEDPLAAAPLAGGPVPVTMMNVAGDPGTAGAELCGGLVKRARREAVPPGAADAEAAAAPGAGSPVTADRVGEDEPATAGPAHGTLAVARAAELAGASLRAGEESNGGGGVEGEGGRSFPSAMEGVVGLGREMEGAFRSVVLFL